MLSQISNFDYDDIEAKMDSANISAFKKLNKALPTYLVEPLASLLASSWWENNEDAEKIAEFLDLEEEEIAAMANDKEWMRDILYDKQLSM